MHRDVVSAPSNQTILTRPASTLTPDRGGRHNLHQPAIPTFAVVEVTHLIFVMPPAQLHTNSGGNFAGRFLHDWVDPVTQMQ